MIGLFSDDDRGASFRLFEGPVRIVTATSTSEVLPALVAVESAVDDGLHAAGYITYEAASGLDPALVTCAPRSGPLLCFGLFRGSRLISLDEGETLMKGEADDRPAGDILWTPTISRASYSRSIGRIRCHLREGDCYQVNFTFKITTTFNSQKFEKYFANFIRKKSKYFGYLQTENLYIVSVSPELFFELNEDRLRSRPMKGTSRRGLNIFQDSEHAKKLKNSAKERAENLMILDMIRNDVGRIAEPGTVQVPALFEVETHPTVLQMTSTVECRTTAGFAEILTAMFPCASVTGAPKIRTMQIITQLEARPRGLYTGTMGFLLPGRRARFNVAIRTVEVDRATGGAQYGVGSGVVWDSTADGEYGECLLKADVLTSDDPDFDLLETILWEEDGGYFLIDGHLERLKGSAAYFGYPLCLEGLRRDLDRRQHEMTGCDHRVRVLLSANGDLRIEGHPLRADASGGPGRVGLAQRPVRSTDVFLHHKTTHRRVYEEARMGLPYDDVILFNERREITESTTANIVLRKNSEFVTPILDSGLLNGVFRQHLIDHNKISEMKIFLKELGTFDEIFLINSVRKWLSVSLDCNSQFED